MLKPQKIYLEASTLCSLSCPLCPTANGKTIKTLGRGYLKFKTFKKIVDDNPGVYSIELSNWGEVFLNKELNKIMEYAFASGIALSAGNGSNMNNLDEDIIKALVKYRFRKITCSIDGATNETYKAYRVNGDFDKVISTIKKINKVKARYRSFLPILHWRFIIFGHNAHEVGKAREMAKKLNMTFSTKLSWDDLYSRSFSNGENIEKIRHESGLLVASRKEYLEKYEREYNSACCLPLWISPYINYDGRMLGCSINYWSDFGSVLRKGITGCFNGRKINIARNMLLGKYKEDNDIPCARCKFYKKRKERKNWIRKKSTRNIYIGNRTVIKIQNKLIKYGLVNDLARFAYRVKRWIKEKRTEKNGIKK